MGSNLQNLGCRNFQNLGKIFFKHGQHLETWLTPSKKSFISMAFKSHSWGSIHDYFFGWNLCKNTLTPNLYNFLIHPFQNMHLNFVVMCCNWNLNNLCIPPFFISFSFDSLKTCWDLFNSCFNPPKTSLDLSKTCFNLFKPIGASIKARLEISNYWKM